MSGTIAQSGFDRAAEQAARAAAALQCLAEAARAAPALWSALQNEIKVRGLALLEAALGLEPQTPHSPSDAEGSPPPSAAAVQPLESAANSVIARLERQSDPFGLDQWTRGATEAWAAYVANARETSAQIRALFDDAFNKMGDAVFVFATTGKFAFSDFAKSIIADMATIAARQAATGLLSLGVQAVTAAFAGAGKSTGATQAGYTPQYFPQAQGGVWDEGVQLFDRSKDALIQQPTAFGLAGGGLGLMGEAGPEAIMPLARTASGALGVRASGAAPSIYVNAPVTLNMESAGDNGMQLDQVALQQHLQAQMKAAAERAIAESWVPGGTSYLNASGR